MKNLSIRHIYGKGRAFNNDNYEILADGIKLDTTNLRSVDIDTYLDEAPAIILRYQPHEIEINLDAEKSSWMHDARQRTFEKMTKAISEIAEKEVEKVFDTYEIEDKNQA